MCAWGASAGGHLAVFLGVDAAIHPGDMAALDADQSPQVTCVADFFGPVDLTVPNQTSEQIGILSQLMGVPLNGNQSFYRDASPLFLVSVHSVPMYIVQGTQDTLVPLPQSQALQQALSASKIPVTLQTYPGGHSFVGISPSDGTQLKLAAFAFIQRSLSK